MAVNQIDGMNTVNVWDNGQPDPWHSIMDKQRIVLPTSFQTQTLSSIHLTDAGQGEYHQRLVFNGVTVASAIQAPRQYPYQPSPIPNLSRLAKWVPNTQGGGVWQQLQAADVPIAATKVHVLIHGWGIGSLPWVMAEQALSITPLIWNHASDMQDFTDMAAAISSRDPDPACMILAFSWLDESATYYNDDSLQHIMEGLQQAYISLRATDAAALQLKEGLLMALPQPFTTRLHFIGHSHGARVAVLAAIEWERSTSQRVEHITLLDSPDTAKLDWVSNARNHLERELPKLRIGRSSGTTFVDNYLSDPGRFIGLPDGLACLAGEYRNEPGLAQVVDVKLWLLIASGNLGAEIQTSHDYPRKWYSKATRYTTDRGLSWSPLYTDLFEDLESYYEQDWWNDDHTVDLARELLLKSFNGAVTAPARIEQGLVMHAYHTEGHVTETASGVELTEGSPAYWDSVLNLGPDDSALRFDYQFLSPGDGDALGIWIDGQNRFLIQGNLASNWLNSATIDVRALQRGSHFLTVALHNYGATNADVVVSNFRMVAVPQPLMISSCGMVGQGTNATWQARLTGLLGWRAVVIEASTNLSSWQPILTNNVSDDFFDFVDSNVSGQPGRFYRARKVP